MPKKRKTLPKNFEEILEKGDLNELKTIFSKCEIDAYGGYGKTTALAFDKCPHELAEWLINNGANLHSKDTWGNTPLHNRARSRYGNIKSLIALGAEVNETSASIGTPLHAAVDSHNIENTRILIEHKAQTNLINNQGLTPLELCLRSCRNIDIVNTLEISKILKEAGAKITSKAKEFLVEVGKEFEFHKSNFHKESVEEVSQALNELYEVFDVSPVKERLIHDGSSIIQINTNSWEKQFNELWKLLVPSNGPAQTIQGEVIRISGRISDELKRNGGINWDKEYNKMVDAFYKFVQLRNGISREELDELARISKEVRRNFHNVDRICELAVNWVILNPTPIELLKVDYKR